MNILFFHALNKKVITVKILCLWWITLEKTKIILFLHTHPLIVSPLLGRWDFSRRNSPLMNINRCWRCARGARRARNALLPERLVFFSCPASPWWATHSIFYSLVFSVWLRRLSSRMLKVIRLKGWMYECRWAKVKAQNEKYPPGAFVSVYSSLRSQYEKKTFKFQIKHDGVPPKVKHQTQKIFLN